MTDARRAGNGRDIPALFAVLRRHGWIVALCVLIAGGAAYEYAKSQAARYEASAQLLLRDAALGPAGLVVGTPTPNTAPDREALVLAEPIKDRAVKALRTKLGVHAAGAVADVTALSSAESKVVTITATASTGPTAALIANTMAQQNIAYRKAASRGRILQARQVALKSLRQLGRPSTDPQQLVSIAQLRASIQALTQAAGVQTGDAEILQRATVPSTPTSPKPDRAAVVGGFAGLLLGFALALAREQLDRRLRGSQDLGDTLGLPILANVPTSRAYANNGANGVDSLPAAEREAFQMLRANLRFLGTNQALRSVVVTSAASGDGKTTVALNLAKADASVGRKVLLLEADMRRPSIASLLGLTVDEGLATYLAATEAALGDVIHSIPVTQGSNGSAPLAMDVLVCGTIPTNPSELINSERMRKLIREAESRYDLVVIDTSPVGIVADAIPVISAASAVIVVSRVGRITSVEANALRDQLERIDAPALGLVANFAGSRDKSYGYY